jgi:hypothetical protein
VVAAVSHLALQAGLIVVAFVQQVAARPVAPELQAVVLGRLGERHAEWFVLRAELALEQQAAARPVAPKLRVEVLGRLGEQRAERFAQRVELMEPNVVAPALRVAAGSDGLRQVVQPAPKALGQGAAAVLAVGEVVVGQRAAQQASSLVLLLGRA